MSRRRIVALAGIATLTLPLLAPTMSWAADPDMPPVVDLNGKVKGANATSAGTPTETDRMIVAFKKGEADPEKAAAEAVGAAASELAGAAVTKVEPLTDDTVVVTLDKALSAKKLAKISKATEETSAVKSAEASGWATIDSSPIATPDSKDQYWRYQWNLSKSIGSSYSSNADTAWSRTKGKGIRVAVIDTGITAHPDLTGSSKSIVGGNVIAGYDFLSYRSQAGDGNGRDKNPTDTGDWCDGRRSSWHGTHVAGIIAAKSNNNLGVSGVAPRVKIQPLRALGHCGGPSEDIIAAIRWGAGLKVSGLPRNKKPAHVLNLSLGGAGTCPASMQSAINSAVKKGVVVVASAGNSSRPVSGNWPANCNNVVRVAATGPTGYRADYSNYGNSTLPMTIAAPGGTSICSSSNWANCILSTWNSGTTTKGSPVYGFMVGTSQAAPHVAAIAAEVKAINPKLSAGQIKWLLTSTATKAPCGSICGAGVVNGGAAVKKAAVSVVYQLKTPKITGKAKVGKKLYTKGKGASPATYKYQWLRNRMPISGATKKYYKVTKADKGKWISVKVTAWYKDVSNSRASSGKKIG